MLIAIQEKTEANPQESDSLLISKIKQQGRSYSRLVLFEPRDLGAECPALHLLTSQLHSRQYHDSPKELNCKDNTYFLQNIQISLCFD